MLPGQVQPGEDTTLGAWIGCEGDKTRLTPLGACLSASDSPGPGAEIINAGPSGVFARSGNLEAKNGG